MPLPPAPALTLTKAGTVDMSVVFPGTRADAGDRIVYTLTATNAGNVTLTGVTIVDPKLGTLACTPSQPATLAPGAQIVCTGSYTLTQADLNGGVVSNTATGDSDQTTPTDATETVTLPQAPALALTKDGTLDMTVVAPDEPRRRRRQGQLHADGGEHRQRDADGRDGRRSEARRRWCARRRSRRSWRRATQLVCTGSYTLTQADLNAGQVGNTATADSGQTPPTEATETVPLPPAPALTLVKNGTLDMTVVAPSDRADAGDRIVYTLTAANVGNVTLTGVTVVDPKLGALVVHADAAGDAGAGRDRSSARAATR